MNRSTPILLLAAAFGLGGCPDGSEDLAPEVPDAPAGSQTITVMPSSAAASGESRYSLTTSRALP